MELNYSNKLVGNERILLVFCLFIQRFNFEVIILEITSRIGVYLTLKQTKLEDDRLKSRRTNNYPHRTLYRSRLG